MFLVFSMDIKRCIALREEHILTVFRNGVLRQILDPKRTNDKRLVINFMMRKSINCILCRILLERSNQG